jgi:hypothetical protein
MTNATLETELKTHLEHFYELYKKGKDMYCSILGVHDKELDEWSFSKFWDYQEALKKASGLCVALSEHRGFVRMRSMFHEQRKNARFYINSHDEETVMEIVAGICSRLNGSYSFQIKTIGPHNYGFARYDNTILYVNMPANLRHIADALKEMPENLFDEETPFAAKKISKGICYAFSPPSCPRVVLGKPLDCWKYPFNDLHAKVLETTFEVCKEKNITDLDEMAGLYAQALEDARFDPENPHLWLGLPDPIT